MNQTVRKQRAIRRQKRLEAACARRAAHPVLEGLELPADASGRAARIIVLGGERALVENCRGVEALGERQIRLRLGEGALVIEGEGLSLTDVRADAACVRGRLHTLRLPGAEDGHD